MDLQSIRNQAMNQLSGMGGSGDMSGASFKYRPRTNAIVIEQLMRQELLLRNMVEAPAEDIIRAWRTHPNDNPSWMLAEEELGYKDIIKRALEAADAFGGCIIVPRYSAQSVNADMMSKPMPAIRPNNLLGFRIFLPHELRCWDLREGRVAKQAGSELPEVYTIDNKNDGSGSAYIKLHHSWTIPMFGANRLNTVRNNVYQTCECLFGESKVDMIFDHLARVISSLQSGDHILQKSNIDIIKLANFSQALAECSDDAEMMKVVNQATTRVSTAVQGSSIYQMMVLSEDESLERKGMEGGSVGIRDMIKIFQDTYVAASKIPHTRLFGDQAKGLSNGGEADLTNYYDFVESVREDRALSVLNRMDEITIADRGLQMEMWEFGNLHRETPRQRTDRLKAQAELDQIYVNLEIPFIKSKIARRLHNEGVYEFSGDELETIEADDALLDVLPESDDNLRP